MQPDVLQRLRTLASGLCERATTASAAGVGDSFDSRVADTLDLIEHGEPRVAFENLAQNVYEFDVSLSQMEYQAFNEAGQSLKLDPNAWIFLADLVR
jgi:hypothetical protein